MTEESKGSNISEIRHEPVQAVIDNLEKMLKEAKNGDLRAYMAVKLFSGGESGKSWGGLKTDDTPRLLGEILMMASSLFIRIDGVDADDIRY